MSALARRRGIIFHTDAAQSAGKISTDVQALGVDLLTIAGHKIYAPKGVGALYVREGLALERLMDGAGQEGGRRPGTENVLEIVGLGKACEVAERDLARNTSHMRVLRSTTTDSKGHFRFARQLGKTVYYLRFDHAAFNPLELRLKLDKNVPQRAITARPEIGG